MARILLPWLTTQVDPSIPSDEWADYHATIATIVLLSVILFLTIILLGYQRAARARLIRRPGDLFGRYTPVNWLFLSLVPGAITTLLAWYLYSSRFQGMSEVGFFGHAAGIGVWTLWWTFVLSLLLLPRFTPPKFRYRPWKAVFGQ